MKDWLVNNMGRLPPGARGKGTVRLFPASYRQICPPWSVRRGRRDRVTSSPTGLIGAAQEMAIFVFNRLSDNGPGRMVSRAGRGVRHQEGIFADQRTRAGDGITTCLGVVTQDCSELPSAAVDEPVLGPDHDISIEKSKVCKFGAGPEIDVFSEDGITKIGKMSGLGIV